MGALTRVTTGLLLAAAACGGERGTGSAGYDVVLRGGWIADGTGNPRYQGDVAIQGDRIVALGFLGAAQARETVDVQGLVVAPGFIDMLGQSETNVLADNRLLSKVTQGITTEVTGEGSSVAPLTDALAADDSAAMRKYHYREDWRALGGYFPPPPRTGSPVNIPPFLGGPPGPLPAIGETDPRPPPPPLTPKGGVGGTLNPQGPP